MGLPLANRFFQVHHTKEMWSTRARQLSGLVRHLHAPNALQSQAFCAFQSRRLSGSANGNDSSGSWKLVQQFPLANCLPRSRLQCQIASDLAVNLHFIPVLQQEQVGIQVFLPVIGADSDDENVQNELFQLVQDKVSENTRKPLSFRLSATPSLTSSVLALRSQDPKQHQQLVEVQVRLPYLVDLNVSLAKGSIVLSDKFEGTRMHLAAGSGDVDIAKLRAEQIVVQTKNGHLTIRELVEAKTLKVIANNGAVKIQKILANACELSCSSKRPQPTANNIEIGAIYANTSLIKVRGCTVSQQNEPCGQFKIDTLHGYLHLSTEELNRIEIGGVNGNVDVEDVGTSCEAVIHFDSMSKNTRVSNDPAANLDGDVDLATSTNGSSIMVAGDVVVSMEPQIGMQVECHGQELDCSNCQLKELHTEQLDDKYSIFTGHIVPQQSASSGSPFGSGKINLHAAKQTAMTTSFFTQEPGDQERGEHGETENPQQQQQQQQEDTKEALPQLVVHTQQARVKLEQLNWMQRLQRKHLSKAKTKAPKSFS